MKMSLFYSLILLLLANSTRLLAQDSTKVTAFSGPQLNELHHYHEEMPRFSGCEHLESPQQKKSCAQERLLAFLKENLHWPQTQESVKGRVITHFAIEADGSVTDVEITRALNPLFDAEVLRVIRKMPPWIPGKQMGRAVRVLYYLPVNVNLQLH